MFDILFNNRDEKFAGLGMDMHDLITRLYPICRSITGKGVRETLKIIREYIDLKVHEVPSGTRVFDWTVPKEWNIKDAYIKDSRGRKVVDFRHSNLHVVNYSIPVNAKMSLAELKKHLYTLPDQPELIPYLTSYYNENWGFCLSHNQFMKLQDDIYEIAIDSSFEDGSLTYGEFYLKGRVKDEILLSTYTCHPSLCNDNLSGPALLTFLVRLIADEDLRYSYRFLFIPETIGAITWLSLNENKTSSIKQGLVATCVGDRGCSTYKRSCVGDAEIDRAVENVLRHSNQEYRIIDFFPSGSDERQFSSPGFNIPVGSLMRSVYGAFPEYHTSADNLGFVGPEYLADSLHKYLSVIYILENNRTYLNLNPRCEPQLGRRGLYRKIGSSNEFDINEMAVFWVLNQSDGKRTLLDITERSGLDFKLIKAAADGLYQAGLLKEINSMPPE